ncbi:MAG: hypothetical protein Faunusvirus52_9 [Faunusvirus sp.]|jgi:hypothetical protein|uniref:Uncharacterized protein n=1 Tax=Faunusvirus sp. TaxID=2487766 RepID=A0A3G4ZY03_9VIRU|nr:MAG: hypothetical protein Faunusvirus52_9 [Faunusvirus sp.]
MISKIANDILDKLILQLQNVENKNKIINNIILPLFEDLIKQTQFYTSIFMGLYALVLLLLIVVLIFVIKK